ncbi:LOW QUALITY PROTEIN: hypothetical protein V1477_010767 [Vespula maculifrons]|uniref:Uncharacterized protein n=1 Tax=Vespula maculifrons TaxID=7453 RepID=A0ABD2C2X4_VESMC
MVEGMRKLKEKEEEKDRMKKSSFKLIKVNFVILPESFGDTNKENLRMEWKKTKAAHVLPKMSVKSEDIDNCKANYHRFSNLAKLLTLSFEGSLLFANMKELKRRSKRKERRKDCG